MARKEKIIVSNNESAVKPIGGPPSGCTPLNTEIDLTLDSDALPQALTLDDATSKNDPQGNTDWIFDDLALDTYTLDATTLPNGQSLYIAPSNTVKLNPDGSYDITLTAGNDTPSLNVYIVED